MLGYLPTLPTILLCFICLYMHAQLPVGPFKRIIAEEMQTANGNTGRKQQNKMLRAATQKTLSDILLVVGFFPLASSKR